MYDKVGWDLELLSVEKKNLCLMVILGEHLKSTS